MEDSVDGQLFDDFEGDWEGDCRGSIVSYGCFAAFVSSRIDRLREECTEWRMFLTASGTIFYRYCFEVKGGKFCGDAMQVWIVSLSRLVGRRGERKEGGGFASSPSYSYSYISLLLLHQQHPETSLVAEPLLSSPLTQAPKRSQFHSIPHLSSPARSVVVFTHSLTYSSTQRPQPTQRPQIPKATDFNTATAQRFLEPAQAGTCRQHRT